MSYNALTPKFIKVNVLSFNDKEVLYIAADNISHVAVQLDKNIAKIYLKGSSNFGTEVEYTEELKDLLNPKFYMPLVPEVR